MAVGHSATELLAMPKKGKTSECPILAVPNFAESFWCKMLGVLNFFKPFWCKKIVRNLEWPKLGIPIFFPTILVQKDWEKFGKVYGFDWTNCISTAATEAAVAIVIAQWECCPNFAKYYCNHNHSMGMVLKYPSTCTCDQVSCQP